MDDELGKAKLIATAGMRAQATRLRVVSENLANVDSLPQKPGEQPYRRHTISFRNVLDRETGVDMVKVSRLGIDKGPLERRFMPSHPAADENGYVLVPNVNPLVEMMNMREAERSYEANLRVLATASDMTKKALELMR